jgi:hypothetical protein
MREVFDLLAAFLSRSPLADDPLSTLLPGLPRDKAVDSLSGSQGMRTALATFGKPTVGALGALRPYDILAMPLSNASGGLRHRHEILLVLVREGSLLAGGPEPAVRNQRAAATPSHPVARTPGDAVTAWFDRLDPRQRDLITLHLCAARPVPVDELAARHRTLRAKMGELVARLPQDLRDAAEESAALGRAVSAFERATSVPVLRADLLDHHPWLADYLEGTLPQAEYAELSRSQQRTYWRKLKKESDRGVRPLVIDVLAGVLRGVAEQDGWLYCGELADVRQRTIDVLQLRPGDSLSWAAATRLQRLAGDPAVLTRPWLEYCGLRFDAGRVERPAEGRRPAGAAEEYPLAPPRTEPVAVDVRTAEPAARTVAAAAVQGPAVSGAGELVRVLEQLYAFATAERPEALLAELLQEPDQLPPALKALADRFLAAHPGDEGWVLPEARTPEAEEPSGEDGTPRDAQVPRAALGDRARVVLDESGHPLSTQLLMQLMGVDVRLVALKSQLSADPRFTRSDVDAWALAEWGLRTYTNLKDLVAQEVDKAGGAVPRADLVAVLTRDFSVQESSVQQMASTPPFTTREGVVRRLSDVRDGQPDWQQPSMDGGNSDDEGPSADDLMDMMGL